MELKGFVEEDFANYKKIAMFLIFPKCSFKCCKEAGCDICQNSPLARTKNFSITYEELLDRYINNNISESIVMGGLEPLDSFEDVITLVQLLRTKYNNNDDIVIYTGFYENEITEYIDQLKNFSNIIIKFGRFIPNQKPHYDEVLGVNLASDNQYAQKIS